MKKILTFASVLAVCLSLSGCIIVPDGPGVHRHGYYEDRGCFHCWNH